MIIRIREVDLVSAKRYKDIWQNVLCVRLMNNIVWNSWWWLMGDANPIEIVDYLTTNFFDRKEQFYTNSWIVWIKINRNYIFDIFFLSHCKYLLLSYVLLFLQHLFSNSCWTFLFFNNLTIFSRSQSELSRMSLQYSNMN